MELFLEIIAGTQKGSRMPLRAGLVLGRKDCDLTIRDSKLSSKHAKVEQRTDGSLWLVDLESQNGIKAADGQKVPEVQLNVGATFTIGRTELKVLSADGISVTEETPTSVGALTVTRTFWDNVREVASFAAEKTRAQPRELTPFNPALLLKFTRGVQAGTEWVIGYGPRSIGASSIDLHLEDPTLPAHCFRLLPDGNGARIENETDQNVRLNGKKLKSATLKNGDVIDIVNTQIVVKLDASS